MELFIFPLAVLAVFIAAKLFLFFAWIGNSSTFSRMNSSTSRGSSATDGEAWQRHLESLNMEQPEYLRCDDKEWENLEYVNGDPIPEFNGEVVFGNYPQRHFERQLASGDKDHS